MVFIINLFLFLKEKFKLYLPTNYKIRKKRQNYLGNTKVI